MPKKKKTKNSLLLIKHAKLITTKQIFCWVLLCSRGYPYFSLLEYDKDENGSKKHLERWLVLVTITRSRPLTKQFVSPVCHNGLTQRGDSGYTESLGQQGKTPIQLSSLSVHLLHESTEVDAFLVQSCVTTSTPWNTERHSHSASRYSSEWTLFPSDMQ